jgi:hypothetical protein
MNQRFHLYAIHGVANTWREDEPFDPTKLPFEVAEGVRVEDVSPFIKEGAFKLWEKTMGDHDVESLERVHFALVYRYNHDPSNPTEEAAQREKSEFLLRHLAALLRLIRPMRQDAVEIHGEVNDDGTFDVQGFGRPIDLMEVPHVQKLFVLRNRDLEDLRKYAPEFLRAMRGEYWKFRMAIHFHDSGHFRDEFWKVRFSLWCSSIEALFTSSTGFEHKGSLVAKERIKWFLGENTPIYSPGDIPKYLPQCAITVKDVVSDLYAVRNHIVHGDRVPDCYLTDQRREGVTGYLNTGDVLFEAASFIIRASLLKILREGLLEHFKGASESDAYYGAQGLTNAKIRKRQKQQANVVP